MPLGVGGSGGDGLSTLLNSTSPNSTKQPGGEPWADAMAVRNHHHHDNRVAAWQTPSPDCKGVPAVGAGGSNTDDSPADTCIPVAVSAPYHPGSTSSADVGGAVETPSSSSPSSADTGTTTAATAAAATVAAIAATTATTTATGAVGAAATPPSTASAPAAPSTEGGSRHIDHLSKGVGLSAKPGTVVPSGAPPLFASERLLDLPAPLAAATTPTTAATNSGASGACPRACSPPGVVVGGGGSAGYNNRYPTPPGYHVGHGAAAVTDGSGGGSSDREGDGVYALYRSPNGSGGMAGGGGHPVEPPPTPQQPQQQTTIKMPSPLHPNQPHQHQGYPNYSSQHQDQPYPQQQYHQKHDEAYMQRQYQDCEQQHDRYRQHPCRHDQIETISGCDASKNSSRYALAPRPGLNRGGGWGGGSAALSDFKTEQLREI